MNNISGKAVRFPRYLVLVLQLLMLMTGSTRAEAPEVVRTALIGVPGLGVEAVEELLFAELVQKPGLEFVERQRIEAVLEELEIGLSGVADPQVALRAGRLVGAQLLAVLQPLPEFTTPTGRFRIIEVRSAVVLEDELGHVETWQQDLSRLVEAVESARASMAVRDEQRRYVAVLDVLEEGMPRDLVGASSVLRTLLSHDLRRVPGVTVLDRDHLGRLFDERRLTGEELNLPGAVFLLDGSWLENAEDNQQQMTLRLRPMAGGEAQVLTVRASDLHSLRQAAVAAIVQLWATQAPPPGDMRVEAAAFAERARVLREITSRSLHYGGNVDAIRMAEVAAMLDPTFEHRRLAITMLLEASGDVFGLPNRHFDEHFRLQAFVRAQEMRVELNEALMAAAEPGPQQIDTIKARGSVSFQQFIPEMAPVRDPESGLVITGRWVTPEHTPQSRRLVQRGIELNTQRLDRLLEFYEQREDWSQYCAALIEQIRFGVTVLDGDEVFAYVVARLEKLEVLAKSGSIGPREVSMILGDICSSLAPNRRIVEWLSQRQSTPMRYLYHLCSLRGAGLLSTEVASAIDYFLEALPEDPIWRDVLTFQLTFGFPLGQESDQLYRETLSPALERAMDSADPARFRNAAVLMRTWVVIGGRPNLERRDQIFSLLDRPIPEEITPMVDELKQWLTRRTRARMADTRAYIFQNFDLHKFQFQRPERYPQLRAVSPSENGLLTLWTEMSGSPMGMAINRLDGQGGWTTIARGAFAPGQFNEGWGLPLIFEGGGWIFVSHGNAGLMVFRDGQQDAVRQKATLPGNWITGMAWLHDRLYVAISIDRQQQGVFGRYDPSTDRFETFAGTQSILQRNTLEGQAFSTRQLVADPGGSAVWLLTSGPRSGLWRYDIDEERLDLIIELPANTNPRSHLFLHDGLVYLRADRRRRGYAEQTYDRIDPRTLEITHLHRPPGWRQRTTYSPGYSSTYLYTNEQMGVWFEFFGQVHTPEGTPNIARQYPFRLGNRHNLVVEYLPESPLILSLSTGDRTEWYNNLFLAVPKGEQPPKHLPLVLVRPEAPLIRATTPPESLADRLAELADSPPAARPAPPAPRVGHLAPSIELDALGQQDWRLADVQERIIVLHFWADWAGTPSATLRELAQWTGEMKARERSVEVVAVNVGNHFQDVSRIGNPRRNQITFLLDNWREAADAYGVIELPETFVIYDGRIIAREKGWTETLKDQLDSIIVETLANER